MQNLPNEDFFISNFHFSVVIKHHNERNLEKEVYFGVGYQVDKSLSWQGVVAAGQEEEESKAKSSHFQLQEIA